MSQRRNSQLKRYQSVNLGRVNIREIINKYQNHGRAPPAREEPSQEQRVRAMAAAMPMDTPEMYEMKRRVLEKEVATAQRVAQIAKHRPVAAATSSSGGGRPGGRGHRRYGSKIAELRKVFLGAAEPLNAPPERRTVREGPPANAYEQSPSVPASSSNRSQASTTSSTASGKARRTKSFVRRRMDGAAKFSPEYFALQKALEETTDREEAEKIKQHNRTYRMSMRALAFNNPQQRIEAEVKRQEQLAKASTHRYRMSMRALNFLRPVSETATSKFGAPAGYSDKSSDNPYFEGDDDEPQRRSLSQRFRKSVSFVGSKMGLGHSRNQSSMMDMPVTAYDSGAESEEENMQDSESEAYGFGNEEAESDEEESEDEVDEEESEDEVDEENESDDGGFVATFDDEEEAESDEEESEAEVEESEDAESDEEESEAEVEQSEDAESDEEESEAEVEENEDAESDDAESDEEESETEVDESEDAESDEEESEAEVKQSEDAESDEEESEAEVDESEDAESDEEEESEFESSEDAESDEEEESEFESSEDAESDEEESDSEADSEDESEFESSEVADSSDEEDDSDSDGDSSDGESSV